MGVLEDLRTGLDRPTALVFLRGGFVARVGRPRGTGESGTDWAVLGEEGFLRAGVLSLLGVALRVGVLSLLGVALRVGVALIGLFLVGVPGSGSAATVSDRVVFPRGD